MAADKSKAGVVEMSRREATKGALAGLGLGAYEIDWAAGNNVPIPAKDNLRISKLETFLVKPRWLFLKVHTNAGKPEAYDAGDGSVIDW
jgi:galactonate dehydratase